MTAHAVAFADRCAVPSRVAVDLTSLRPGGTNGGAKIVALELVTALSDAAPDWDFVLLTGESTHHEIEGLDRPNVRRICVQRKGNSPEPARQSSSGPALGGMRGLLPARGRRWLGAARRLLQRRVIERRLLRRLAARVLLCPLTAPTYADPAVPTVSIVYDLQHQQYPEFFSREQRYLRNRDFDDACVESRWMVCISDFVRRTVIDTGRIPAARVITIYPRLFDRLQHSRTGAEISSPLDLGGVPFILYPANFWMHKNHKTLFEAFSRYRAGMENSTLRLVCTGASGPEQEAAQQVAAHFGLTRWVIFPGYLSDGDFAAVLQASAALIFPSLYEGFGMPILEAMRCDIPVLCSNVTSMPEIAGNAALLFDPRNSDEIAAAIKRVTTDASLAADLVARGARRVREFGDRSRMAHEYLSLLTDAMGPPPRTDAL